MRFSQGYRLVAGLILILIAVVIVMVSWSGSRDDIAREMKQEPQITVYFNDTGEKRSMGLEEYLQGVVAGEMFPDWPVEAYGAQAIFARSFTLALIAEGGLKEKYGADISTNIEEAQAYNPGAITPEIKQAVENTRGQVLTYEDRYVKGWFHAYSGGITTTAKEGLNYQEAEPPYIKSVDLGENEYAPEDVRSWEAKYTLAELQGLLAEKGINVGQIQDLKITKRGPTDRITEIQVVGTDGTDTIHGADFRIAVDSTKMRSTLVTDWEVAEGVLTIRGTGYGHGVGLSQWDAFKMAKEGKSPQEIATAFFKGVEIKKLYD
ncbi:MAG TPA: SpoIID/LytB domain-containing protein [Firmicutes bacterium]|nr:SpoIID/LytB domain-containing protein [Bacillota bacterium]